MQLWWGCGVLWHPGGVFLCNCCSSPAVITNKKLKSTLPPAPCSCPLLTRAPSEEPHGGCCRDSGTPPTDHSSPPKKRRGQGVGMGPSPPLLPRQALILHILPPNSHSPSGTPKIWGLGERSLGMQIEDLQLLCAQGAPREKQEDMGQ